MTEGPAILRGPLRPTVRRTHSLRDGFSLAGPSVGSRAANTLAKRFVMPAATRDCAGAADSQSAARPRVAVEASPIARPFAKTTDAKPLGDLVVAHRFCVMRVWLTALASAVREDLALKRG
jgi:hypothetical protein